MSVTANQTKIKNTVLLEAEDLLMIGFKAFVANRRVVLKGLLDGHKVATGYT